MSNIIRHYTSDGHVDVNEALSINELQKLVGGYVECHQVGGLCVACDEEGKLKSLVPCCRIAGQLYVGDVYVGKLGTKGLVPAPVEKIEEFERKFKLPV